MQTLNCKQNGFDFAPLVRLSLHGRQFDFHIFHCSCALQQRLRQAPWRAWRAPERQYMSAYEDSLSARISKMRSLAAKSTEDTVDELPNVSGTQMLSNNRVGYRITPESRRCVSATDVRQNKTILNDSTISFRSLAAMNEAYSSRLTPAGCLASASYDNCKPTPSYDNLPTRRALMTNNSSNVVPAFEQARPKTPRNRGDQTVRPRETRSGPSGLKPLLYSDDCAIQHSAGCPYMCKGCFRACLASDNYVDGAGGEVSAAAKYRKQPYRPRVHFADQRNRQHIVVVEKDLPPPHECVEVS